MIFEAVINVTILDKRGNDKSQRRFYILENFETFGEVEKKLYEEFGSETGFEVCAIKISKLKEIINEAPQGDFECKIFFATICDHFITEEGDDKELRYSVCLHAHDINEAHQAVKQYMSQGLEDMELVALKCTRFVEVIK